MAKEIMTASKLDPAVHAALKEMFAKPEEKAILQDCERILAEQEYEEKDLEITKPEDLLSLGIPKEAVLRIVMKWQGGQH